MPTPGEDSWPSSAEPGLPVAAVARRLGVAPATLRTWARRYGLGPDEHAAGAHRRYSAEDVARLEVMRRLTLEGFAPGEAARVAIGDPATPVPGRRGGPGGRVLAVPGAGPVVRGLGRAAMALDSVKVMGIVRAQLAEHGVVPTWEHVLRPVLSAAGARWAATGEGVEVEHLLSDCVTVALREAAERSATRSTHRPALLAGTEDEHHALPLHAVAAGLAERGVASRVLGGSTPGPALDAAVRRTGAAALFLWSQLPGTADPAVVAGLPVTRPPMAVVLGGPGWVAVDLPVRATVARDLLEALRLVAEATGGAASSS